MGLRASEPAGRAKRLGVSAGANIGERLMAVGARHYGKIQWRGAGVDGARSRSIRAVSTTVRTDLFRRHAAASADRAQSRHAASVLRYFNVFGPRQRSDSPYSGVIAKFCSLALDGGTCRVDGDGLQSRDFTYVADVARGNWLAMEKDVPSGTRMNLAGGGRYSLLDLLETLGRIVGREIPREHGPERTGDVKHSQAATELAERSIGFRTEIDFEEGLKRTLDWYRETHGSSQGS